MLQRSSSWSLSLACLAVLTWMPILSVSGAISCPKDSKHKDVTTCTLDDGSARWCNDYDTKYGWTASYAACIKSNTCDPALDSTHIRCQDACQDDERFTTAFNVAAEWSKNTCIYESSNYRLAGQRVNPYNRPCASKCFLAQDDPKDICPLYAIVDCMMWAQDIEGGYISDICSLSASGHPNLISACEYVLKALQVAATPGGKVKIAKATIKAAIGKVKDEALKAMLARTKDMCEAYASAGNPYIHVNDPIMFQRKRNVITLDGGEDKEGSQNNTSTSIEKRAASLTSFDGQRSKSPRLYTQYHPRRR